WHRLSDGRELLALFVHAKDRRWVAWTPRGFYIASPGGEALIGWHVNRGWADAADFFAASRFRNRFYRPDIVQLVLNELDEDKAIADAERVANAGSQERNIRSLLPPVIEITQPRDGDQFTDPSITLAYSIRSPTGERITDVDVYIDDAKTSAVVPKANTEGA